MENNGTHFNLSGILIGFIVGAVTGMLYAPKSGEETRKAIKENAKKEMDNIAKDLDETGNKMLNTTSELKEGLLRLKSKSIEDLQYLEEKIKTLKVRDEYIKSLESRIALLEKAQKGVQSKKSPSKRKK